MPQASAVGPHACFRGLIGVTIPIHFELIIDLHVTSKSVSTF